MVKSKYTKNNKRKAITIQSTIFCVTNENDIQKEIDYFIEMKKNFHGSIDKMTINIDLSKHLFEMSLLNLGDGHLEYIIYILKHYKEVNILEKILKTLLIKTLVMEIGNKLYGANFEKIHG